MESTQSNKYKNADLLGEFMGSTPMRYNAEMDNQIRKS